MVAAAPGSSERAGARRPSRNSCRWRWTKWSKFRHAVPGSGRVSWLRAIIRSPTATSGRSRPTVRARSMSRATRASSRSRAASRSGWSRSKDPESIGHRAPTRSSAAACTNRPSASKASPSSASAVSARSDVRSMTEQTTSRWRASRSGKLRYSVALPTPALRAISSSGTSAPNSTNISRAAATIRSRLRSASARGRGALRRTGVAVSTAYSFSVSVLVSYSVPVSPRLSRRPGHRLWSRGAIRGGPPRFARTQG